MFTLRYDQRARCVYDEDGRLVAQDGDVLESGGGQVERDGGEVCGTREIWVMNGAPLVVGPSEVTPRQ